MTNSSLDTKKNESSLALKGEVKVELINKETNEVTYSVVKKNTITALALKTLLIQFITQAGMTTVTRVTNGATLTPANTIMGNTAISLLNVPCEVDELSSIPVYNKYNRILDSENTIVFTNTGGVVVEDNRTIISNCMWIGNNYIFKVCKIDSCFLYFNHICC